MTRSLSLVMSQTKHLAAVTMASEACDLHSVTHESHLCTVKCKDQMHSELNSYPFVLILLQTLQGIRGKCTILNFFL